MAVLQNIAPEDAARLLRDAFRPVPRRTAVNTFLIHAGGKLALVDTGCGNAMAATGGQLAVNLAASGVLPEEVDTVLLTHMHPDHSNGLADAEGRALFPRAELVMHEAEWAYWHDDAAMARADEASRERNFQAARDQAAPYRDRLRLFKGGEVLPRRHRHALPRPHPRPHRLHGRLRQRQPADLGRHRPRAGDPGAAAGGDHGLRRGPGAGRGHAAPRLRHGGRPTGRPSRGCTCTSPATRTWSAAGTGYALLPEAWSAAF